MPVVIYPPSLPVHEELVLHRREKEGSWVSPIPFVPFLLFITTVFVAGLWAVSKGSPLMEMFKGYPEYTATLIVSLIPPLILVGTLLIYPYLSSPLLAYQLALFRDEDSERQIRWNLAIVATAHVYGGRVAQVEWINQLMGMSTEDRQVALGFIKRVRSRLQQIPVLTWVDWLIALCCCMVALIVSLTCIDPNFLHALFHSLALIFVTQAFMLYQYTLRWQHIRRLMELEDVFEELTPSRKAEDEKPQEDDVTRWSREREQAWTANTRKLIAVENETGKETVKTPGKETGKTTGAKTGAQYIPPSMSDAPPVPWE